MNRVPSILPDVPQGEASPPSQRQSKIFQRKITFGDVESALKKKRKECKDNPAVHSLLLSCEESLDVFQKNILWRETPHLKLAEIVTKIKKINVTGPAAENDVRAIKKSLQEVFTTLRSSAFFLGEGRVKAAYERFTTEGGVFAGVQEHVFLVAKGGRGKIGKITRIFHEIEIGKELEKINLVRAKVKDQGNLVLAEKGAKRFLGRTCLKMSRSVGDLEHSIRGPSIGFSRRLSFGVQLLKGISSLHEAGFVHGDIKPANMLFFPKEPPTKRLKISDFGSIRLMNAYDTGILFGDPRFIAPEGRLSQKGEVYSAALSIIRILEEEVLDDGPIVQLREDQYKTHSLTSQRLRGIEQFVTQNKACPQSERKGIFGILKFVMRALGRAVVAPSKVDLQAAQNATDDYIVSLIGRLMAKHPEIPRERFTQLGRILQSMMCSDVNKRPTAKEALEQLGSILTSVEQSQAGPVAPSGNP